MIALLEFFEFICLDLFNLTVTALMVTALCCTAPSMPVKKFDKCFKIFNGKEHRTMHVGSFLYQISPLY